MPLLGRLASNRNTPVERAPRVEQAPPPLPDVPPQTGVDEPGAAMAENAPNPVEDEVVRLAAASGHRFVSLKMEIARSIRNELGARWSIGRDPENVHQVLEQYAAVRPSYGSHLEGEDEAALFQSVLDEVVGYGPLELALNDDSISEIMVNGPSLVYVERKGKLRETDLLFEDDAHVVDIIERIAAPLGRQIDGKWPMLDGRLPDGSRVNAIIAPCALSGPTITIRKFSKKPLTAADLVRFGSASESMIEFLRACVVGRLNIVVSGGTGSGKTTLLNVLSGFIPADERIVTIQDAAELQLQQKHVVTLESKPAERDGSGRVTIRDLVINSLRMRPERIIVGECRGGEALDMLQAMNTGHDGSMTTLHANSARDAIARLETLVMLSGVELPIKAIRQQISSAVDVIIQQSRLRDGSRKITGITEVQGMEGDVVILQDVFGFREEGIDPDTGKVLGKMEPQGIRPKFMSQLEAAGLYLPPSVFGATY
ncbi:MAG: CpaF family protein [Chloroflexota bacterium]|nr:MAG: CpaF family protein [Chloroflexota bacterium]